MDADAIVYLEINAENSFGNICIKYIGNIYYTVRIYWKHTYISKVLKYLFIQIQIVTFFWPESIYTHICHFVQILCSSDHPIKCSQQSLCPTPWRRVLLYCSYLLAANMAHRCIFSVHLPEVPEFSFPTKQIVDVYPFGKFNF